MPGHQSLGYLCTNNRPSPTRYVRQDMDTPSSLHHYTDAAGLLGILGSRSLWATDCRFLNDSTEYTYAQAALDRALRNVPNPALDPKHHLHDIRDEMGEAVQNLADGVRTWVGGSEWVVAVTCFCEDGDLLGEPVSGYASNHGYSIEFDVERLKVAATAIDGVEAQPCSVLYGRPLRRAWRSPWQAWQPTT